MSDLFDGLSRALAEPMPRRRALRLIVSAIAGSAFGGILGARSVLATACVSSLDCPVDSNFFTHDTCCHGQCCPGGGYTCCPSGCVGLDYDPSNCGGCGIVCQSGQVCNRGACQTPTPCPSGSTCCQPICGPDFGSMCCGPGEVCGCAGTPTFHPACIKADGSTGGGVVQVCTAGCGSHPPCSAGLTCCSRTCVDLKTDVANCGSCGNVCCSGECAGGQCMCSGKPYDPQTQCCEYGSIRQKHPIAPTGTDAHPANPSVTHKDLGNCPARVPHKGYVPTFNGCGPDLSSGCPGTAVPDNPAGADFFPACKQHDICYGTCNTPRTTCDSNFLSDMRASCKAQFGGPGVVSTLRLEACYTTASAYFIAVDQGGQCAYEYAQSQACDCCLC